MDDNKKQEKEFFGIDHEKDAQKADKDEIVSNEKIQNSNEDIQDGNEDIHASNEDIPNKTADGDLESKENHIFSDEDTLPVVQASREDSEKAIEEGAGADIQKVGEEKAAEQKPDENEAVTEEFLDPISEYLRQRKRRIIIGLAIVAAAIAFLLAGWSYKNMLINSEPETNFADNEAFLLVADGEPDNLYLQIADQEKVLCFKDVIPSSAVYLRKTDRVLAVSKNGTLLIKEPGRSQAVLTTKVIPESVTVADDESALLFLRTEKKEAGRHGDLYILKMDGVNDKEKLASNVYIGDYDVSSRGEKALYIADKDLYLFNGHNKTRLGSEVIYFNADKSMDTITFVNSRQELFKWSSSQSYHEKIAAAEEGMIYKDIRIADKGEYITYIENFDVRKNSGELYLQKGGERTRLASDVRQYEVVFKDKRIYYLNDENDLFAMGFTKDNKIRIGSHIDGFAITDSRVVFLNKNLTIYYAEKDGGNRVRIAGDVTEWMPAGKMIVFLNGDDCLFSADFKGNHEKLSEHVKAFSIVPTRTDKHAVVYYNKAGDMFVKNNSKTQQKMKWRVNDYLKIYLLDQLFFERLLGLQDIAGLWLSEYGNGIIEFTRDGKCRYISQGQVTMESDIKLANAAPDQVDVFTFDNEYDQLSEFPDYHICLADASHLFVNDILYNKITAEEFKKIITEAISSKLEELDSGLAIADQYDAMRVNFIDLVEQLNEGEISWYYFLTTINKARNDRIALFNQVRELQNDCYDPALHDNLAEALINAVNYCEACYYAGEAYSNYYRQSYINDAANYASLLQQDLDKYRETISQEQEKLKEALPQD